MTEAKRVKLEFQLRHFLEDYDEYKDLLLEARSRQLAAMHDDILRRWSEDSSAWRDSVRMYDMDISDLPLAAWVQCMMVELGMLGIRRRWEIMKQDKERKLIRDRWLKRKWARLVRREWR